MGGEDRGGEDGLQYCSTVLKRDGGAWLVFMYGGMYARRYVCSRIRTDMHLVRNMVGVCLILKNREFREEDKERWRSYFNRTCKVNSGGNIDMLLS